MRRIMSLMLVGFAIAVASLVAASPAYASEGSDDGRVSPEHIIICIHFATEPSWAGGDTVRGRVYWDCNGTPDYKLTCGQMEVWAFDDWVTVGPDMCTSSTNPVGSIEILGTCVGYPGNWSWKYRIHFGADVFHDFWDSGENWGPEKYVAC